jgi:hypothetical protein
MAGAKAMRQEATESDSLSRAIGDFRDEFVGWIDTELARLREREREESLVSKGHDAPGAPPSHAAPVTESGAQAPPLNPRQRLDALARLLDCRLKQSQGAGEPSREAVPERTTW